MELTVNHHPVFVYTGGVAFDPARPAVVFIHGAAHDHSVWALQTRYLAHHGHAVLAPDLPGHGRSGGAPLASVEALADWVIALLDAAGLDKAVLVGHSMGAMTVLEAAARHPARVSKIALLGAAFPMGVSEALLAAAQDDPETAYKMVNLWSHAPATHVGGNPTPGVWQTGLNLAIMRRSKPGVLHRDLLNCQAYLGGLDAAAKVACPALLVCADRDLMTPPRAVQGLRDAIAGVKVASIAGAGHAMMAERPDAVLDALRDFV